MTVINSNVDKHMYNLTKIKCFRVSIIKPGQTVFKTHIFKKKNIERKQVALIL